jgi:hypothetical protein
MADLELARMIEEDLPMGHRTSDCGYSSAGVPEPPEPKTDYPPFSNFRLNTTEPTHTSLAQVFDALIVGMDLMSKKCRNLKYRKRIYVLTDAASPINFEDEEALEQVGSQLKNLEMDVTIMWVSRAEGEAFV